MIDIDTEKVIRSFEYDEELIIPNELAVMLRDKNKNTVLIYENIDGIYIKENNKITPVVESKLDINWPNFENNKYSEILKVLYQEILFNIKDNVPIPNIMTYNSAWYRDTLLATMVLEKTDNVKILEPWVKSIDSIYDYSRAKDLKEPDGLGALMYIIGATGVNRDDLIQKIIEEIDNIREPDGSIKGKVDGWNQKYYPTALAILGSRKLGIDLNLQLPEYDDGYARLTWYLDKRISTDIKTVDNTCPYLNWAYYHYNPDETLTILGELYPLSYEIVAGETNKECFISEHYCNEHLALSHIWHASEMFLVLINY